MAATYDLQETAMPTPADREKSSRPLLAQIDRQFGKGSVMRLGSDETRSGRGDSHRLDRPGCRTRHRRAAPRPHRRDLRPGVLGQDHAHAARDRQRPAQAAVSRRSSTRSTRSTRSTPSRSGSTSTPSLVSQPDTGEQALEIADMLVRSGSIDLIVIDSVRGPRAARGDRGRNGRLARRPPGPPHVPGAAQAHPAASAPRTPR